MVVTGFGTVYVASVIPRVRHLLLAWLVLGLLQLGLLGVPMASGQVVVGSRDLSAQSAGQSVSVTKRLFVSERSERTAATPFAPSAIVVIGLADAGGPRQSVGWLARAPSLAPAALPPARGPPGLV